jgi:hypothetical protein
VVLSGSSDDLLGISWEVLKSNDGTSIAQAISTASSTGQAQTVAQAIAEACTGGERA